MSLYSVKPAQGGVQPWIADVAIGKGIFDFYDSLGDVTISADTNIPSVLDGPMVVRKYRDLTINAAANNVTLTTTNRCRGLMLLVEGNLLMQRTASYVPRISMTGRGARGHAGMGQYDFSIPASIQLSGKGWSKADALKMIQEQGYAICDHWLWDDWGKVNGVSAAAWTPGTVLLTASGCGVFPAQYEVTTYSVGTTGAAGANGGCGSGGSGGLFTTTYRARNGGGHGNPWGGGAGGGGLIASGGGLSKLSYADHYGGKGGDGEYNTSVNNVCGGGAGNPGGKGFSAASDGQDGTGGLLVIIVKGAVTLNAGAVIDADGMPGGNVAAGQQYAAGGGSGGGHVSIITLGTLTNSGTIRANGGAGGAGGAQGTVGGSGGAGQVVTKTFGQMGW